jgi:hypothetical protein
MSLVRSNRPRWSDYTRAAPANQLDDGTGDTFVLGPWNTVRALQAASPIESGLFLFVLNLILPATRRNLETSPAKARAQRFPTLIDQSSLAMRAIGGHR